MEALVEFSRVFQGCAIGYYHKIDYSMIMFSWPKVCGIHSAVRLLSFVAMYS